MSEPHQSQVIQPDKGFFATIQYHQNISREVMLELLDLGGCLRNNPSNVSVPSCPEEGIR